MKAVAAILFLTFSTLAFKITKSGPQSVTLNQGDDLDLSCTVDDWYEWCTFRHASSGKICDFEWKRDVYNITLLDCSAFADRFEFIGDYNGYNCAVRIKGVTAEDAGEWSCSLENYYGGQHRGYGYSTNATMNVEVRVPTTTTTTTTTTITTTTTEKEEEYDSYDHDIGFQQNPDTDDGANESHELHQNDEINDSTSMTYIILGISFAILVCLLSILLALHFKRKLPPTCYNWSLIGKSWKQVDANETAEGAVEEDEDDKDKHASIVKNGKTKKADDDNINPTLTIVTWSSADGKNTKNEDEEKALNGEP